MDKQSKTIGENEALLADICRRVGAGLSFSGEGGGVEAVLSGDVNSRMSYKVKSLLKRDRETACESIMKQLLFPDVAEAVGIPKASSVAELVLKLNVAMPS